MFHNSSSLLSKLNTKRNELSASEATGISRHLNQLGINMVDLMMWLVIAALLLAAALQGIGYYQQAAWTYQAKNDVASVRSWMEAQYTLNNNVYPGLGQSQVSTTPLGKAIAAGDLKLTNDNTAEIYESSRQGWRVIIDVPALAGANKPALFDFGSKDDPATVKTDESSNQIPARWTPLAQDSVEY